MRVGAYALGRELGRGGMGTVYRATGPDGRPVAVKVLKRFASEEARGRFERERRLLASLGAGEGFVPLLDAGEAAGVAYLVMPLLAGGTLRDRLRAPLALGETVALGRRLARAMAAAHARGIVHRDLKPENVLFDGAGEPFVADLGLAKHFDRALPGGSQSFALSTAGAFRGTAGYMPPEQMTDASAVGPGADVFALGAILYECLAGKPAFSGETMLEVCARVSQGEVEPLGRLRPDAPPWLVAAIERALASDPGTRWPDAAALEGALRTAPEAPATTSEAPSLLAAMLTLASERGLRVAATTAVSWSLGALCVLAVVAMNPGGLDERLAWGDSLASQATAVLRILVGMTAMVLVPALLVGAPYAAFGLALSREPLPWRDLLVRLGYLGMAAYAPIFVLGWTFGAGKGLATRGAALSLGGVGLLVVAVVLVPMFVVFARAWRYLAIVSVLIFSEREVSQQGTFAAATRIHRASPRVNNATGVVGLVLAFLPGVGSDLGRDLLVRLAGPGAADAVALGTAAAFVTVALVLDAWVCATLVRMNPETPPV